VNIHRTVKSRGLGARLSTLADISVM
jgi:hypothetical protein